MKPNCKPGDMAIIVRCVADPSVVGFIVKVVSRYPWEDELAWYIDPPLPHEIDDLNNEAILDACLRPIRDPGEDATDEMVALLGRPASQPSKETA